MLLFIHFPAELFALTNCLVIDSGSKHHYASADLFVFVYPNMNTDSLKVTAHSLKENNNLSIVSFLAGYREFVYPVPFITGHPCTPKDERFDHYAFHYK